MWPQASGSAFACQVDMLAGTRSSTAPFTGCLPSAHRQTLHDAPASRVRGAIKGALRRLNVTVHSTTSLSASGAVREQAQSCSHLPFQPSWALPATPKLPKNTNYVKSCFPFPLGHYPYLCSRQSAITVAFGDTHPHTHTHNQRNSHHKCRTCKMKLSSRLKLNTAWGLEIHVWHLDGN